jgi:hypothetical protein
VKNWFINVKAISDKVDMDGLEEAKISEITSKITNMFETKLFDKIIKTKFIEKNS